MGAGSFSPLPWVSFLVFAGLYIFAKPPPIPTLIKEFEASWKKTETYQSQFKQVVNSKRLGTTEELSGTLFVRKPGRLRWEGSNGVVQILNGKKVILIQRTRRKKNRQIDIYDNGAAQMDAQALSFLSGSANFLNNFSTRELEPVVGHARIQLTPKRPSPETFVAEIDKSGYFLAALTTESAEARVRIEFFDRKINPALSDFLFEYVAEPDDVVHNH